MSAELAELAMVKDHYPVAFLNGRKPVGNDQRRSLIHYTIYGLLDELLGFGIDGTRGFIQDQDLGVKGQSPRE